MNGMTLPHARASLSAERPDLMVGQLQDACGHVLDLCRFAGVDQAQVSVRSSDGLQVGVRLGEIEKLVRKGDRDLSVVVYIDGRKGEAGTGDLDNASLRTTIEKACAIARCTEPDACNGLIDPRLHPVRMADLDLWHPSGTTPEEAISIARDTEAAGRGFDHRIVNSNGAEVESSAVVSVLANSNGFVGTHCRTRHEISASVIANGDGGMQRGHGFDAACTFDGLRDGAAIGRSAAQQALQRLDARRPATTACPVLMVPEVAAGLVQHLASAVGGSALYGRASFLVEAIGKRIFPERMRIEERPSLRRGLHSRTHDADGVAAIDSPLIDGGTLQRYLLDGYSARRLGLETTGNAGGSGALVVASGDDDFDALVKRMQRGLVVCGVMGQGVSLVTGDYSRGAWGLWIEGGEIAYPVDGITIASNLADMYRGVVAVGNDVDHRFRAVTGSWLIDRMTMAGA